MPYNAKERNETQLKILDEAFVLFGRHGYDGMSMKVLAVNSGITKAALYWHYESKDDLYLECVKKITDLVEDHTHAPLNRSDLKPSMKLMCLVAGVRALLLHPAMVEGVAGYWLTPSSGHINKVWEEVRGFRKRSFRLLENTLDAGQKDGSFEFDMPLEDIARTIHYTIESNIIPLAFFAGTLVVRQHAAVLLDAFLRAYSPDHKGLSRISTDEINLLLDSVWREHVRLHRLETYAPLDSGPAADSERTLM